MVFRSIHQSSGSTGDRRILKLLLFFPKVFSAGGNEKEKGERREQRTRKRGKDRERKKTVSPGGTQGGEWEKANVIAVIFGRWLPPGSSLLPLGHKPPPTFNPFLSNKHRKFVLFVLSFSPVRYSSRFSTCLSFPLFPFTLPRFLFLSPSLSLSHSIYTTALCLSFSPLSLYRGSLRRAVSLKYFRNDSRMKFTIQLGNLMNIDWK